MLRRLLETEFQRSSRDNEKSGEERDEATKTAADNAD